MSTPTQDIEHLRIDHVILGVADLDLAARTLTQRHGLTVLPGGQHPAWGTANRIVPLGSTYLEIATVVDPEVAAGTPFGTWVSAMIQGASGWGWVARTDDIDVTARRLGMESVSGSRVRPDGAMLTWRLAGVPADADQWQLPFFVEWGPDTPHPGSAEVHHDCGEVSLDRLVLEADEGTLTRRLGGATLPLDLHPGRAGVTDVVLRTGTGRVTLSPGI